MQLFVLGIGDRPEEYPLVKPQQIRCGKNHARNGPCRPLPVLHEGALQDGELADEAVEQRQSHGGQEHDHGDGGVNRHDVRDAAVLGYFAGVPALVHNADDQEERAGRDAVVDLLQHRAAQARWVQREDSQGAEAQVADRRIRHQLLHVLLHQGDQRAVDDADDREDDHPAAHFGMHDHVREERQGEADESVRSHLQQDAGQDDRTRGGRFHVRIRQPGVEREHRHLDGEARKNARNSQIARLNRSRIVEDQRRRLVQRRNAEGVRCPVTAGSARSTGTGCQAASAPSRPACRGRT